MTGGPLPTYPAPTPEESARARRITWLGVVVGMIAMLVVGAVVWVLQGTFGSGPETATAQCSGASVTGTIWMDGSAVVAQVTVLDEKGREWHINWKTGSGFETLPTSPEGSVPAGAQVISDTDNGTERSIFVRPEGETKSCELRMGVQWLHY